MSNSSIMTFGVTNIPLQPENARPTICKEMNRRLGVAVEDIPLSAVTQILISVNPFGAASQSITEGSPRLATSMVLFGQNYQQIQRISMTNIENKSGIIHTHTTT